MRGIVKTFSGVRALDHVDLEVRTGEIHGLVGKNGAGKSTLVSILSGFYPPNEGEITCGGKTVSAVGPDQAKGLGIAIVPQQVHVVSGLSIAENVFCGELPLTRLGFVDWRRIRREAMEQLALINIDIDIDRTVESLSVSERQMIDIARAFSRDAHVIILDEPTASLPKDEVKMLFGFVREMCKRGVSFIYISHFLEEVFELCDRVTVLRNSRVVGHFDVSELDVRRLVQLISGQDIARFGRKRREAHERPILEIEDVTRPGAYEKVSFTVHAGEIVGLSGLEGSGKSELVRGLFGLQPMGEGAVRVDGRPYRAKAPEEALAQGVAYLPRDRYGLGIVPVRSVAENVGLCVLRKVTNRLGFISRKVERPLVEGYVDMLQIKISNLDQELQFLSGGNQQKVVFAKLAATKPQVLLLEEPTQGVDIQAKEEILRIVVSMAGDGVAVVVVSDVIDELLDICDRILVMHRGVMVAEFDPDDQGTSGADIMLAIEGNLAPR